MRPCSPRRRTVASKLVRWLRHCCYCGSLMPHATCRCLQRFRFHVRYVHVMPHATCRCLQRFRFHVRYVHVQLRHKLFLSVLLPASTDLAREYHHRFSFYNNRCYSCYPLKRRPQSLKRLRARPCDSEDSGIVCNHRLTAARG